MSNSLGYGNKAGIRMLLGRIVRTIGAVMVIFCAYCLYADITGKIYFITGLIIGVLIFFYGLSIKGKKIIIDEETGRVKKKHL